MQHCKNNDFTCSEHVWFKIENIRFKTFKLRSNGKPNRKRWKNPRISMGRSSLRKPFASILRASNRTKTVQNHHKSCNRIPEIWVLSNPIHEAHQPIQGLRFLVRVWWHYHGKSSVGQLLSRSVWLSVVRNRSTVPYINLMGGNYWLPGRVLILKEIPHLGFFLLFCQAGDWTFIWYPKGVPLTLPIRIFGQLDILSINS